MREPDQVQVSLVVTLRVYDHTSKRGQTCCPSLGGMDRERFRTSPWPEASYLIDRVPIAHRDLGSFSLRYGITSTCPTIHVSRPYFFLGFLSSRSLSLLFSDRCIDRYAVGFIPRSNNNIPGFVLLSHSFLRREM